MIMMRTLSRKLLVGGLVRSLKWSGLRMRISSSKLGACIGTESDGTGENLQAGEAGEHFVD